MTELSGMKHIYLHRDVVDFRKSINGLMMIVDNEMDQSPFSEALFVFCNRGRDKIKALYWDKTGFCLWYKRLEKDKFKWPRKNATSQMHLSSTEWKWLLSGLDLSQIKTHKPLFYHDIS